MADKDLLFQQLLQHLPLLYPEYEIEPLAGEITAAIGTPEVFEEKGQLESLNEVDCLLISYGDSIVGGNRSPLTNLKWFLDEPCRQQIPCVHILPFYPYSSDDGFSVIDYLQVREDLGDWQDVEAIAEDYTLMVDLVINHISSESRWFQEYLEGKRDGYFIEAHKDDDLSQVVRPRVTPLLRPTETSEGMKQVWCTFSHDQIDVNFGNPEVLIEYLKIIAFYLRRGGRILRLDAIGYLWKRTGTTCIHLPETHEVIRLIRNVCEYLAPGTQLITETNVPNQENLTYFGNRNEAHAIYNFSLPPLLVHALLTGETKHLKQWMMSMPPAPDGCFYLNFTASHDGIGMRPAEGLLSNQEQLQMIETIRGFGGLLSTRQAPDGSERVYEINISLFDALQGTTAGKDQLGVERFLCSQTVMMGVEGIPAFYVHSLLATPNDLQSVSETGRNRSINRHRWDLQQLESKLEDPGSNQSIVLNEILRRIGIRSRQPAFHPNATQFTLQLGETFFAFWRQSRDREQSIFAVHNLSSQPQMLRPSELNLISIDTWFDLISGETLANGNEEIEVQPYQCMWISNRDGQSRRP
ncbi:MAG: sugar phosphorylase [Planctomycetota bacterium]